MSNTWRAIIDPDAARRACVFCGGLAEGVLKAASVDEVFALLAAQDEHLGGDALHCTYQNLCLSTLAASALAAGRTGPSPLHDKFAVCSCCAHWVAKRVGRPNFLFPLQALQYHLQSMPFIDGKQLDTRVVHRLSVTLGRAVGGKSNFFRAAFSEAELAACAAVAAVPIAAVTPTLAAFMWTENARAPFLRDARLTELVRCLPAAETAH